MKKKMGRPPLPKGESKESLLRVRLSDSEKKELNKQAKESGKPASEIVRGLIQQGAEVLVLSRWEKEQLLDKPLRVICAKFGVEFKGRIFACGENKKKLWVNMTVFGLNPEGRSVVKTKALTQSDMDALQVDGEGFVLHPPNT